MRLILENKLFYAFCLIAVVTSFFSIGFYHVDEHFQILEFANYKMNLTPADSLPWEFQSMMRPTLQVSFACIVIALLKFLHFYSPFTVSFLLRFTSALLCLVTFKRLSDLLSTKAALKYYYLFTMLWFIPYLCCRYTSETWSGIFFFLSVSIVIKKDRNAFQNFLLGALLGASFWCRFQSGFLILGLIVWLLFIRKITIQYFLLVLLGGFFVSCMALFSDYWVYDKWVLTPYHYFYENIVLGKAKGFGSESFWFYLMEIIIDTGGIIGVALLFCIVFFSKKYPTHIITFSIVPFIVAHSFIAHKEMRFLFPIFFVVPFLLSASLADFIEKYSRVRWFKILSITLITINFLLLIFIAFKPADTQISFQQKIYNLSLNQKISIYFSSKNPYERVGLSMSFYQSKSVQMKHIDSFAALDTITFYPHEKRYFICKDYMGDTPISNQHLQLVYQSIPDWILYFNLNNWVNRTGVYRIYKVDRRF